MAKMLRSNLVLMFTTLLVLSLVLPTILLGLTAATKAESAYENPDTTGLYGGLIHWIEVIDLGDNKSRVFISTQSANSIFYADVDHNLDDPYADILFQIVPDLDADAGFGEIRSFAVDEVSGWLYFTWWPEDDSALTDDDRQPGIYRCTVEEGSLTYVEFESESEEDKDEEDKHGPGMGWVEALMVHDSRMFFIEQTWNERAQTDVAQLRFCTIDETTGELTEDSGSPIYVKEGHGGWIKPPVLSPADDCLYILDCGEHWGERDIDSVLYKTSDKYDELSSSTTFEKIVPPKGSLQSPRQYEALGIAPDGVLFLAGWQQNEKGHHESLVVYSNDDGDTWETGTRDEYCWAWPGPNFAFLETADGYDIVCGTMVSEDGGETWGMLPRTGNVWPHPGAIAFDPNGEETFYVQMDRGIAVTTDSGYSFSKAWDRPEGTGIEDIEVVDMGNDKSGIFIRENEWGNPGEDYHSSSKVYYGEIDHSGSSPSYGDFQEVPGMGDGSSWEIWSRFAGDSTSHSIYFEGTPDSEDHEQNGLYRTDGLTAPTRVEIESGYASRPLIYDGRMFFVDSSWGGGYWVDGYWIDGYWEDGIEPTWVDGYEDGEGNWVEGYWTEATWIEGEWVEGYWVEGNPASNLHFGTIGTDGIFTAVGEAEITDTEGIWPECMVVDPDDGSLYILTNDWETGTTIYRSSDAYNELSSSTTFTEVETPSDTTSETADPYNTNSYEWHAFGVGLDGQLFLGGWSMGESTIAYSENDGTTWETVALENDYCGIGDEFAFLETETGYDSFCGTMVSGNKGVSWSNLPRKDDSKAHPNSACVQIDPNNPQALYIPTSKGIGVSADAGYHFVEINEGVEAVQIKDMVLDPNTGYGWAVAKSGVRRIFNYNTDPEWSSPMDPDGEGAWYNTVDMDLSDETGRTAYVGTEWGDRLYKTTDGGATWKCLWRPEPQYEPDEMTDNWNWANWCGHVSAIKVDPYDSDRVFVGYSTGRWGWGDNMEEMVFGQLWVINGGSEDPLTQEEMWMHGPQHGRDWTQILLYRDESESKTKVENTDDWGTWYALKGDVNVHDILIIQEDGETVIYVAASYSDETADPITDEEKMHNGLYDRYGCPMIYEIYRITGDNDSGWDVETEFGRENASVTALSIDSNGTLYAAGKDYSEDTYEDYIDDYEDKAREEMKQKWQQEAREEFRDEAHDCLYDEMILVLFDEGTGADVGHNDWDGHFDEAFEHFYNKYFDEYSGEYNDEFDSYFEECFEEYLEESLLKEFDKHFDEDMDEHFDDFWEWNKPQEGLRVVYTKALGDDWEALPLDGLNRVFRMHCHFDFDREVLTVGQDPADSTAEVPYIAYNRFIYYLPDGSDEWVLGIEYPAGTEIYTMVGVIDSTGINADMASPAEEVEEEEEGAYLYVGTGTGMYGQIIVPTEDQSDSSGTVWGLPLGLIIGVAVGVVAMIGICSAGTFFIWRRSNRSTPIEA